VDPLGLEVGQPFPELEGTAHDGRTVRLADLRGRRRAVVYFYPRDLTPGCTREAIDFDRKLEAFSALETDVVGVSVDPPASHRRFAASCGLRFPLLTDEGGRLAERLGILGERGTARRTTYVIDRDGTVRRVFHVQRVDGHVDEVLAAVRELAQPAPGR
jgi:peroxiredoxin Q/BCP